jgi:thiol-disulfide isomerase/thioredoxin
MKLKKIWCAVPLMLFLLASCKDKAPEEKAPKPMNVYEKEGVKVNAYDFSRLEYFLNRKNDTTYVVNFWATWCVPCVQELPHFEKLNTEHKDQKVKVLLVSLDMHKMVESRLIPFIKEKNLQSDVVLLRDPDANSWIDKVDKNWSGAIPATVIYRNDKRNFYEKSFTYAELEKEVNNFKQ